MDELRCSCCLCICYGGFGVTLWVAFCGFCLLVLVCLVFMICLFGLFEWCVTGFCMLGYCGGFNCLDCSLCLRCVCSVVGLDLIPSLDSLFCFACFYLFVTAVGCYLETVFGTAWCCIIVDCCYLLMVGMIAADG